MDIYVLRHGLAGEHKSTDPEVDRLRPLTAEGRKKMRRAGAVMRAMKLELDLILTSPYTRASQTAVIVAKELRIRKRLKLCEHLSAGGDPHELTNELAKEASQKVMLVGHEPYLSELISVLLSGKSDLSIALKKGGICKLTVEKLKYGRCATLEWLMTGRMLSD